MLKLPIHGDKFTFCIHACSSSGVGTIAAYSKLCIKMINSKIKRNENKTKPTSNAHEMLIIAQRVCGFSLIFKRYISLAGWLVGCLFYERYLWFFATQIKHMSFGIWCVSVCVRMCRHRLYVQCTHVWRTQNIVMIMNVEFVFVSVFIIITISKWHT